MKRSRTSSIETEEDLLVINPVSNRLVSVGTLRNAACKFWLRSERQWAKVAEHCEHLQNKSADELIEMAHKKRKVHQPKSQEPDTINVTRSTTVVDIDGEIDRGSSVNVTVQEVQEASIVDSSEVTLDDSQGGSASLAVTSAIDEYVLGTSEQEQHSADDDEIDPEPTMTNRYC